MTVPGEVPPATGAAEVNGQLVGALLTGSWRDAASPLDDALHRRLMPTLLPLVYQAGGAGLVLRRLLPGVATTAVEQALRDRHRRQVLDEMLHAHHVEQVVGALAARGIEPVVIKGWTVARAYPKPGLRPFGDVDVVVAPAERVAAEEALAPLRAGMEIDIHDGIRFFAGRDAAAVRARLRRVTLRSIEVSVLGAEDELALMCRHTLDHGAWRALALCDVGRLVEERPASFDWDYLRADSPRAVRELDCALLLARRALGATLGGPALDDDALPRWLLPALYRGWGTPYEVPRPLSRLPRTAAELLDVARRRFRDPITATAAVGPWNDLPRLPFQALDLARRTGRFLRRQLRRPSGL